MPRLPHRKVPEEVLERPAPDRPLTPAQLRGLALELRRHAARFAETETQMTAS